MVLVFIIRLEMFGSGPMIFGLQDGTFQKVLRLERILLAHKRLQAIKCLRVVHLCVMILTATDIVIQQEHLIHQIRLPATLAFGA